MKVRRFDYAGHLKPAERTKEGYLRCEGLIARAGNVQEYTQADGKIHREYRPPEEVFSANALASLDGLPFTKEHPPTLLDAATAKQYAVGAVTNPRREGEYVGARIVVYDADMIAAMEQGKQELSVGYECELDPTPGLSPSGERYDARQTKIIANHVAGVDSARAGAGARVRLDDSGHQLGFAPSVAPCYVAMQHSQPVEMKPMPSQIRLDGHAYSSDDPALQQVIDRQLAQARADGEKATKTEKERADALAASLGHVKANAISRGAIVRSLTSKLDAMKAKMVECDECDGSGKVKDGDAEAKCDYCDGKGSIRMHGAIKKDEAPELVDDADLESEEPKEEVKQAADHGDAEEIAAAQKRRADSIGRMVARAASQRAALIIEAQRHLGADAKLDGKSDLEIKREVVAKLAAHIKLDGKSAEVIEEHYVAARDGAAQARKDGAVSASDLVRAGTLPVAGSSASSYRAELQKKIDAANHAKYHSHERTAAK